ncbi:KAT8 regulatory NSL complex subunit 2-like [Brachionus plicatilis]|uniref:KAT8 regulatory NSL complex subunit 2-like n=1 Tax=Brachionus plicatilis TaxID=10195 RepID=A0A3M7R0W1_BRAPC|nr:KAT8 regulatory NSL complex subunit 2-like [Brachionus plicatilis]
MIYWKDDDKNFNEIEHCLKNKQDADESGDEDITDNLIDIDSDPEFMNFSNDSSDQIMHQIIKQHSVSFTSEAKNSNNETNEENLKQKNLESVGLDLSKKTVYTKNELIKIYKLKLSKLKLMYRKQLRILNDKLIVDRKKYLDMIKSQDNYNCSGNFSKTYGGYRSLNQIEAYIKEKYDPRCNAMSNSEIYRHKSTICYNKCIHKFSSSGNNSACNQIALPQSKFCQYHIGFDSNQFGFCNCSLIPEIENYGVKQPLIRDVIHKCDNNIEEENRNFGKNASDFELMQVKVCIPEHLIEIHNKYLENIKKCEANSSHEDTRNVISDSIIDDNFPKKFNLKIEASEANTISKESESAASSSSDSSTSTTSDSNMSILSSSSSSTTDSGEESEAEKN